MSSAETIVPSSPRSSFRIFGAACLPAAAHLEAVPYFPLSGDGVGVGFVRRDATERQQKLFK